MPKKPGLWIAGGGAVLAIIIVWAVWPGSPTAPTAATTSKGRLDVIEQPESIWQLVPKPSGTGLAADDYNKGVVEYYNSGRYAELQKLSPEGSLAIEYGKFPYRPYKFITAGAKKRRMNYFAEYVPPAVAVAPSQQQLLAAPAENARPPLPHLTAFDAMASASLLYGTICEKSKHDNEAERIYKAVLVFGHHIGEDRVRLYSLQLGLDVQLKAARHLAALYKRQKRDDDLPKVTTLQHDLTRTIETVNAKAAEAVFRLSQRGHLHPGDLMNVAANDADPMWRIEAIRQLGLCRAALSQGGKRADYNAITQMLNNFAKSDNPFIRAAAELALKMTIDDVRNAY